MRNVKVLWGVSAVLLTAVIVLSALLAAGAGRLRNEVPDGMKPESPSDNEAAAVIGDTAITKQELVNHLVERYGKEMLDHLIDREVLRLEGEQLEIRIHPSEIEQELKRMQRGYDSEQQFFLAMKEQLGLSEEALRSDVHDRLLAEKIATRDIRIDDAVVTEYMQAYPEEFKERVEFRIQQIVVGSHEQAARAVNDLERGIDFSTVAKERSLDDATRDLGGDLGWVEADDPFIPEPILNQAGKLKAGEISQPFELDGKVVIIKLRERKEDTEEEKQARREQLRKELALREATPLGEMMEQLREKWGVTDNLSIDKD